MFHALRSKNCGQNFVRETLVCSVVAQKPGFCLSFMTRRCTECNTSNTSFSTASIKTSFQWDRKLLIQSYCVCVSEVARDINVECCISSLLKFAVNLYTCRHSPSVFSKISCGGTESQLCLPEFYPLQSFL